MFQCQDINKKEATFSLKIIIFPIDKQGCLFLELVQNRILE